VTTVQAPDATAPGSGTSRLRIALLVSGVALVFCYADVLLALARQWEENSTYSYGYAIPLIAGYVTWTKWPALRAAAGRPAVISGGGLLVASLLVLQVGRLGALMSLEGLSLVTAVAALVLLFGGWPALRVLRFPVAYLLLMVPVWGNFLAALELPGRRIAAASATLLLRVAGIPALHHGTTIDLPNVSLEVMAECSGINQLLALTIMVLPASVLWLRSSRRRLALVGCSIVLGYASNAVRVAILGLLSYRNVDVHDPHSLIHLAPGFLSIGLAYAALSLCLSWLARGERAAGASVTGTAGALPVVRSSWAHAAAIVVLLLAGLVPLMAASGATAPPMPKIATHLPGWTIDVTSPTGIFPGFSDSLLQSYPTETGVRRFDAVDQELVRNYRGDSGGQVQLYVAYYGRQADGRELTGDVSRALQKIASPVILTVRGASVPVNEVVQADAGGQHGLLFWYDVNGRAVASIYRAKLLTVWDAVTRGKTAGAAFVVSWRADDSSQAREAREAAIRFADALLATGIRPIS
jgi:EpsI family protein